MFLEITIAILLGVASGVFTGLIPGVHINLVAAILLGISPVLAQCTSLLNVAILIVSMSVTHNFLDMLPAIFLGAPEDATALGVLPGHRYLIIGQGMMAVKLTVLGGLFGTFLAILSLFPAAHAIAWIVEFTNGWLVLILAGFIAFSILRDRKPLLAFLVFCLSGFLGLVVLRLPLDEPLLPMLSGLFGTSTLLYSINEQNTIPEQKELDYTRADTGKLVSGTVRGAAGGLLTAIFPGISSALAAALVSRGSRLGDHGFMILLGSLGSAGFVLSLSAWIGIEKARNGAMAIAVSLQQVDARIAWIMICAMLIATGIAVLLTLLLGKSAARWLPKLPYRKTCIAVIAFVTGIVLLRAHWLGFLILATSTAVGLVPAVLKTARVQAMGCLLLPLLVVLW